MPPNENWGVLVVEGFSSDNLNNHRMENYSWNEHTIEEYKRDIQRMSKEDFKSEIERFVATCQLEDGDTNEMLRDSLIIDIFKNLSLFEQIELEMSYLILDKDDDYYSSDLNVAHENIIFDSAMDLNLVNQDWFDDRLKHSPIERMYELHDAINEELCLHYGQFYENVKHMSKFLGHLLDRYVSESKSIINKSQKL
tara:strand:+ start:1770 stop:2357 length:588 start_codon:yes stop_codon:yes gene_type:complete